jgi:hypothetical protein
MNRRLDRFRFSACNALKATRSGAGRDHGIIIDRPNPDADEGVIRVAKVRFEETGEKGVVRMRFDRASTRFLLLDDT